MTQRSWIKGAFLAIIQALRCRSHQYRTRGVSLRSTHHPHPSPSCINRSCAPRNRGRHCTPPSPIRRNLKRSPFCVSRFLPKILIQSISLFPPRRHAASRGSVGRQTSSFSGGCEHWRAATVVRREHKEPETHNTQHTHLFRVRKARNSGTESNWLVVNVSSVRLQLWILYAANRCFCTRP
jgi:hypothetical protein